VKYLFGLVAVLIAYGSLFPFDFVVEGGGLDQLWGTWGVVASRGDLLSNIVLFLPFGFFGMLAFKRPASAPVRFAIVLLLGAVLSLALQTLQLRLPDRYASLTDVTWNIAGAAIGAALATNRRLDPRRLLAGRRTTPALLLIGCWLAYRWTPFVPSLDWQAFKESLKPLLLHPQLSWIRVLHDAVAWLAVAALRTAAEPKRLTVRFLPLLMLATFGLEVLIVNNAVSASNVSGAAAALLLWWILFRRTGPGVVAALLAALLVLMGLEPFEVRESPAAFHWIPFHGFLGGSMALNVAVLFEKTFLYGSFLWLLRESGARLRAATAAGVLLAAGIEIAQTRFLHHTPEITDPLLMLLVAGLLGVVSAGKPANGREPLGGVVRA
jgi:hypothetical protein